MGTFWPKEGPPGSDVPFPSIPAPSIEVDSRNKVATCIFPFTISPKNEVPPGYLNDYRRFSDFEIF